jgi:hypothetical protein
MGCVTADSERAGLDSRTVGMMLGVVEVGSPFVHPVNMRTSWAVSYHNDSCLLVVVLVVPITCHCWHCSCVGHHHGGCNHLINHLHIVISYSLNVRHFVLVHGAKYGIFQFICKG